MADRAKGRDQDHPYVRARTEIEDTTDKFPRFLAVKPFAIQTLFNIERTEDIAVSTELLYSVRFLCTTLIYGLRVIRCQYRNSPETFVTYRIVATTFRVCALYLNSVR